MENAVKNSNRVAVVVQENNAAAAAPGSGLRFVFGLTILFEVKRRQDLMDAIIMLPMIYMKKKGGGEKNAAAMI